jgi:hypothetical protein
MKKQLFLIIFILNFVVLSLSQTSTDNSADEARRRDSERRAAEIQQRNIYRENLEREKQEAERNAEKSRIEKSIERKQVKKPPTIEIPTDSDKKLLEPSKAEKLIYKDFLKNKNSGLMVLFRYPNCELYTNNKIVNTDCENNGFSISGGGSHYSFRNDTYVKGNWLDIQFMNDELIARGNFVEQKKQTKNLDGYVQGIIVNLGNTKIEEVNSNNQVFNWLKDFVPATDFEQAKKFSEKLHKGVTLENYTFGESAKLEIGNTYLLRSIPYRIKKPYYTYGDKVIDIIVVLQVVKRENDRLLLIWKEIFRQKAPTLKLVNGVEKVI